MRCIHMHFHKKKEINSTVALYSPDKLVLTVNLLIFGEAAVMINRKITVKTFGKLE